MELVSSKDTDGCFMEIVFIETRFSQRLFSEKLHMKSVIQMRIYDPIKRLWGGFFVIIVNSF